MKKEMLLISTFFMFLALFTLVQSVQAEDTSLPALGQTETGENDPVEVTEGILPVPDYSGDWKTRRFLSGEWGGLRQDWANKGITFDVEWLQVGQGIVSGGRDQRWAYATNIDYYINLDLMRMGVLPGALISFRGQSRFGSTVNEDTGLLLPVNTFSDFPVTSPPDENVIFTVTELNWLQFLSDELGVLLGKITTMSSSNEFAGGEGRSQFMNFQFSFPSVVAQFSPYSTLAVGGVWLPSSKVTVTSMLLNLQDASTTSGFDDIGDGTIWSADVDFQYRLEHLPGGMTLSGMYAFDGEFARIGGLNIDPGGSISIDTKSTSWSFYLDWWQYIHIVQEPPETIDPGDGRQDLEGLGVFVILGLGDRDINPVSWSAVAGLSGRGMIPSRGDDTWGLGYFYNALEEPRTIAASRLANSTQGLEAYYNFAVIRSVALTLDVQWTRSAFRHIDDALVLGARLNVSF